MGGLSLAILVSRIVTFDSLSWLVTILGVESDAPDTSANNIPNQCLRLRYRCPDRSKREVSAFFRASRHETCCILWLILDMNHTVPVPRMRLCASDRRHLGVLTDPAGRTDPVFIRQSKMKDEERPLKQPTADLASLQRELKLKMQRLNP